MLTVAWGEGSRAIERRAGLPDRGLDRQFMVLHYSGLWSILHLRSLWTVAVVTHWQRLDKSRIRALSGVSGTMPLSAATLVTSKPYQSVICTRCFSLGLTSCSLGQAVGPDGWR